MSNDDLIARLRDWADHSQGRNPSKAPFAEAADEIEALQARVAEWQDAAGKMYGAANTANKCWAEEIGKRLAAEARADALAGALRELVKINEDHNRAIERIIGSPPGWNDSYLDRARAALQEKGK